MDIATYRELPRVGVRPPPRSPTTRGVIDFLCLYRSALAHCWDRAVILRMSFDEVRDRFSDGGLQGRTGSKAFPLPPWRVMWEVEHIASRKFHGQVKGSCRPPTFLSSTALS